MIPEQEITTKTMKLAPEKNHKKYGGSGGKFSPGSGKDGTDVHSPAPSLPATSSPRRDRQLLQTAAGLGSALLCGRTPLEKQIIMSTALCCDN